MPSLKGEIVDLSRLVLTAIKDLILEWESKEITPRLIRFPFMGLAFFSQSP